MKKDIIDTIPYRKLKSADGIPVAIGKIPINRETVFGLNPDDKIVRIGCYTENGKTSSSCRVHEFKPYIVYSGWSYASSFADDFKIEKFLLFRDPLVTYPLYALYAFTDSEDSHGEIYQWNFKYNFNAILKTEFTKLKNPP
jgi:hypothetical protein